MSLILGITVRNLERIAYFATYAILDVQAETRDQMLADLEAETEAGRVAIKIRYEREAGAEGANIGLVLNLASYARINEYGFIETPYLKVNNGKVTDEIVYVDASEEIDEIIADAGAKLDANGKFVNDRVSARKNLKPEQVDAKEVTLMDAAHKQILGSTASSYNFV